MNNFLVYKSSAGSGKTYTLMLEYLTLALKYPSAYRNILAITFTNKAAAEIKERIISTLKRLSADISLMTLKDRELVEKLSAKTGIDEEKICENATLVLSSILHNYSDFAVSTIDSFMHRVIRSFAFDLKLSQSFEIELDTAMLLNAAVDEMISKVGKDSELTELLKDYVIRKAENDENWDISQALKNKAKALLKEKMTGLMPALNDRPFSGKDFQRVCKAIEGIKNEIKQEAEAALQLFNQAGIGIEELQQGTRGIGGFFSKALEGKNAEANSFVRAALEEGKWLKKGSLKMAGMQNIEKDVTVHANIIIRLQVNCKLLELIRNNFHTTMLLKKINDELQTIRDQRNVIAINDFNTLIAGVVKDEQVPFIYMRVGEKLRHFMIDEFQDTSEMQWENLLPLVENALSDSRLNVLVGDGKQAIYRFKNGDAEQFVILPYLKKSIHDHSLLHRQRLLESEYCYDTTITNLVTNYRSRQEIVEFNNSFFRYAADRFIPEHRNFYNEVEQKWKPDNKGGLVQFDFVPKESTISKVLELVEESKKAGYEYGDITILCRVNEKGVQIAEALQKEGIRVVSAESLLLSSSPEVNFLLNWIAWMDNPEDNIPMVGIIEYLLSNYPVLHTEFIPRKADKHYFFNILHLLGTGIGRNTFDTLSLYDSMELLVRRFALGSRSPVYIRFFLDRVLEFTGKESSGAAGFLDLWDANCKKWSVSMSQNRDAVQIMTVHKSKGLDFPVVIYAFPDNDYNRGDLAWDSVSVDLPAEDGEEAQFEMPLVFSYDKKLVGTPFEPGYNEEEGKKKLDRFNLYYVAFTRASERLHVVLEEDPKTDGEIKTLSQMADLYLKSRDEGFRFGDGSKLEGKYQAKDNTEVEGDEVISLNQQPGDWNRKIVLARRAPERWGAENNESTGSVQQKMEYGNRVHKVLSEMLTLDDPFDGDEDPELLHTINAIKNIPLVQQFFTDGTVIREKEIITPDGQTFRPDRIVLKENVTWVIDFKTGLPSDKHQQQVLAYMELIMEMEYPSPKGCIIYLQEKPEIVIVEMEGALKQWLK